MTTYITFFNVGEGTESLVLDEFLSTEDLILWQSSDEYFSSRVSEPRPIHGGIYSYGLAAAGSQIPDWISEHIVSYKAPRALLQLLGRLDSLAHELGGATWPDWPDED